MSYGERKAKREQEIAGLKEALTILSGESLLQVKTTLRGARRAYPPQRVVSKLKVRRQRPARSLFVSVSTQ